MKARWRDVRNAMPVVPGKAPRPMRAVTGVAIHHSASVDLATGIGRADARAIFEYHVTTRGWTHGGYHYVIGPTGVVEYALDESVAGIHAGFSDREDRHQLEQGQYWNNHLVAVCLVGWFERGRVHPNGHAIPDLFTTPTPAQWSSTLDTVGGVLRRHALMPDAVRGHCELEGCATACPGSELDLHRLRAELAATCA